MSKCTESVHLKYSHSFSRRHASQANYLRHPYPSQWHELSCYSMTRIKCDRYTSMHFPEQIWFWYPINQFIFILMFIWRISDFFARLIFKMAWPDFDVVPRDNWVLKYVSTHIQFSKNYDSNLDTLSFRSTGSRWLRLSSRDSRTAHINTETGMAFMHMRTLK